MSPDIIIKTCSKEADSAGAAAALVKQALTKDGTDNITVVALTMKTDS